MPFDVPNLPSAEIHVWRLPWSTDAAEAAPFRTLLAAYAGPGAPEVARGEHGKPHFPGDAGMLGFSWSHSQDTALFAIGRGPVGFEVGVDVERIRPRARALELARRFFAPAETTWLEGLPEEQVLGGFLGLWTAKEAVLKAHGGGLSYGLHRVAFAADGYDLSPGVFDGDVGPAEAWQVAPVTLGENLVGSVAWRGEPRSVRVFTFPV
ncbi:4'-phosphopantetheinyl transferase superfamily protein [Luteibacter pinisoli]|uniref:4'-phosphopantetheinyl transferase superfamily protein n=1 Tax=Luteibacter pinisoli TaxID=2589080 RepID=A0A4Y5YXR9_9GAMM|nr:4'-phosphopantetheinyl transferase superfamily protein [Luteibacter pinisoli]QDE37701.1 4'-phosphopantetheinyl transferase superfamily protein [Luteibacter pinisoli]